MPDTKPTPLAFTQFLQQHRRGVLHAELTEALAAVTAGVVQHGKPGSLTIKLTVKAEGDGVIAIADTYAVKVPTPPAKASIFFADQDGQISRQRLNQAELPMRGIDGGQAATEAIA